MYSCEFFSVRKNRKDFTECDRGFAGISALSYEKDVNIKYRTDVSPDAKRISSALLRSLDSADAPDVFIFANALDKNASSSFKELFYEFISVEEEKILRENEYGGGVPKIKVFSLGDFGNGSKGFCFRIHEKMFVVLPCASLTGLSPAVLVSAAIDRAFDVFKNTSEKYPGGIAYIDYAKDTEKKQGFFASFIPQKGDLGSVKARKIVVLVALVAFIGALAYVINYFVIGPARNNAIVSDIQEIAYNTDAGDPDDTGDSSPEQDWNALKKINPEIVGWIRIDDTKINYPVLEHIGDNSSSQYYLYRTYKGDYSQYGSVFVDYRCTESTNSKNVILHGHHMNDGSMFENLMGYGKLEGDLDFYKKHPIIVFNTPDGDAKWKIISVFKTNTLYDHGEFFNYMQGSFSSDAEFMNFVYNVRVRSLFNIPVVVNENDQILTLSTCSYEFSNFRTVVVARRVRDGEDENVDVGLATVNKNPVFPDVYYLRYGGTRPEVLTFKTANEKGLITWYDGKGNLKGAETLTATVAANPTEPPTTKGGSTAATQPEEITFYTITYMNYDGSEFESFSVQEGTAAPVPDGIPVMPEDDYYYYTFKGWSTEGMDMENVHYGMNIAPIFEPTLKQ